MGIIVSGKEAVIGFVIAAFFVGGCPFFSMLESLDAAKLRFLLTEEADAAMGSGGAGTSRSPADPSCAIFFLVKVGPSEEPFSRIARYTCTAFKTPAFACSSARSLSIERASKTVREFSTNDSRSSASIEASKPVMSIRADPLDNDAELLACADDEEEDPNEDT